jgi:hypothetical protein
LIQGNRIGTTENGEGALGNLSMGVLVAESSDNEIGGTAPGEGNTIAFNDRGVRMDGGGGPTTGNSVRGNSIHSNTQQGILNIDGGNNQLAPPEITAAGSASGTACSLCAVDVFSDSDDEGRIYEGTVTAQANGDWTLSEPLAGPFITATATDSQGNTSMFSDPFLLPATPTPSPTPSPTPTPTPTASPDASATPSPTATTTAAPADVIQGDLDCDEDIGGDDAILALLFAALITDGAVSGCPFLLGEDIGGGNHWGDVNCDGIVDILDVLAILSYAGELEATTVPGDCAPIGEPVLD